jgi:orotidine-5'-phosphate decarboxylase
MNKKQLVATIQAQKSFLCVGLDPDLAKLPAHLPKNGEGVATFCKAIIDATLPYCASYKLNTAFFEVLGIDGMRVFDEVVRHIPKTHFVIADAKRGDIGNTSRMYAQAFLETFDCSAITVSPYMGEDSVSPFLEFKNKYTIVLGLTSNAGAQDFEMLESGEAFVYQKVMKKVASWGSDEQIMFVIGATQGENQSEIRAQFPHHFFLVPGIGAQGGLLEDTCKHLLNDEIGILIASSREIIYADNSENFAKASGETAKALSEKMWSLFESKK